MNADLLTGIGLPKAEEFEKLDKISRNHWRFLIARVFITDFGADMMREILAKGREEWRHRSKGVFAKHTLKQEDQDFVFEAFRAEIRRRDEMLNHIHRTSRN